MGGLSKKASKIEQIRRQSRLPTLVLDGGALLFRSGQPDLNQAGQTKIFATALVDSYNLMAYDAVGISSRDLAGGIELLLELQARAKFSWLSANLLDKKTGQPLFKPYLEVQAGIHRVAVVGLTDRTAEVSNKLGAEYQLLAWPEILPALIDKLQEKNDFIILLTGYNPADCRDIAATCPRINLIIPAFGGNNHPPELLSDTTMLTQTGRQGEYLGILTVHPQPSGRWDRGEKELLAGKRREMATLNRQKERFRDRPESQGRYRQLLKRIDKITLQIKNLETELQNQPTLDAGSTYTSQFEAISPNLPDDPKVLGVIEHAKKLVAR